MPQILKVGRLVAGMLAAVFVAAQPVSAGAAGNGAPSAPGTIAVASDARLGGDANRTRFIVDLSSPVELNAFTLADPYRVVVDLPQVAFHLPASAGQKVKGLVKAFRYGLVMRGGSRIVIDAAGPVRIERAAVLDATDGQPARMVLDLVATDRDSFMRNLAIDTHARRETATASAPAATPATGDGRPVIVLDPGHGGIDGGTVAPTGETEKEIVLDFAIELRAALERTGKYQVVMTRSDDTFVSLAERVRIARSNNASLFISIHADALAKRSIETRGATVYTVSDRASDAEAARLAEAENRADVIAGVDLSSEPDEIADILIDLAQRETRTFSAQFARTVVSTLRPAVQLHRRPLRSAGFRVLKAPDVPSVLIELGYVSSPQDLKLMTSEAWRKRATEAFVQAVNQFFAPRLAGSPTTGSH